MRRFLSSTFERVALNCSLLAAIFLTLGTLASVIYIGGSVKYIHYAEYSHEILSSPEFNKYNTIPAIRAYLLKNYPMTTQAEKARAIDDFLRRKFSHTYSSYSFHENWIAWLAGLFWFDLRSPVDPHEIVRYAVAGCSQQGLVFQHLLNSFGMEYATVGFKHPHHFAVAAKIDNRWYYFDSDLEPRNSGLVPLASILEGSALERIFIGPVVKLFEAKHPQAKRWVMNENRYPAMRGYTFQKVAKFTSQFGWAFAWLLCGLIFILRTNPSQSYPTFPVIFSQYRDIFPSLPTRMFKKRLFTKKKKNTTTAPLPAPSALSNDRR